MRLCWPPSNAILLLPAEDTEKFSPISFWLGGKLLTQRQFPLARRHIDHWLPIERHWFTATGAVEVELPDDTPMGRAATFALSGKNACGPAFPLAIQRENMAGILERRGNHWYLTQAANLLGIGPETDTVILKSQDLIFWQRETTICCASPQAEYRTPSHDFWRGDVGTVLQASEEEGCSLAYLRKKDTVAFRHSILSMPVCLVEGAPMFTDALRRYRIFKRSFSSLDASFNTPLVFRIAPDIWPEIRLLPAEGTSGDITAEIFELEAVLCLSNDAEAEIRVGNTCLTVTKQALSCNGYTLKPKTDRQGRVLIHLVANKDYWQILGRFEALLAACSNKAEAGGAQVVPVTENISHCRVAQRPVNQLHFTILKGQACAEKLCVFGLRPPRWSHEADKILKTKAARGSLLYSAPHYRVFANAVEDDRYGPPAAFAPRGDVVLSPQRVCEEFAWRQNHLGDMVRAVNRSDIWTPSFAKGRYPTMHSGAASIDAAYNIALDTFALSTDGRFALHGQEGLWSSGFFQGEGQGFGAWIRDSAHIAMRCGSLIDPSHARRTLLYTIRQGFDNGNDGPAMAIVGLWDYYLATGDIGALYEAWPTLQGKAKAIDELFCAENGLVYAPTATSNDCFEEPENGGYALGGETYYMLAYESMAKIAALTGLAANDAERWQHRAETMRREIRARYWNDTAGYFTSGPVGTPAYAQAYWESSGVESTVWSRFGLATAEQKQAVLQALCRTALCEYGIVLYPYKEKINHFTGSVWGVWQAGFAQAAACTKNIPLLEHLLYSQLRIALLNKTFYEVIDASSGIAWRWPGQLWHAAGFISLLYYGVLGIRYDEEGLHFSPAVPVAMAKLRLTGLSYRAATLDIQVAGSGTGHQLFVDERPASHILPSLTGRHRVLLKL